MKNFKKVMVLSVLAAALAGCGGGPGTTTTQPPTVYAPGAPTGVVGTPGNASATVSCTPPASNGGGTITGYTVTSNPGAIKVSATSCSFTVPGLTNGTPYTFTAHATNSAGDGPESAASVAVTPTAPASVPGAPTSVVGTAGNAQISVAFTAPASNGGAAITSYTATCTATVGVNGTFSSASVSGSGSPIVVTGTTIVNGASYACTVHAANSAGNGPESTASAVVTPTAPAPTLASMSPNKTWATPTNIVPVTFTGTNFASGYLPSCTPDSNVLNVSFVNSTTITASLGIDSSHDGYGDRQCKICKADGTGCTGTVKFTVYGQPSGATMSSGVKLALNLGEVIAGENSNNNGYVDMFTPGTGVPNGTRCYVGSGAVSVVVDNLTNLWTVDGSPSTSTCEITFSVPSPASVLRGVAAIKVLNSYVVALQPAATHKISCVNWIGSAFTSNPVLLGDAGTGPQSLAMGVTNGNTYAYSYDAVGQALYMIDASNCTSPLNWPVTGITAGAPLGTEIVAIDASGILALISYGDKTVQILSENTLKLVTTVGVNGVISLPAGETPVGAILVDHSVVIKNQDGTLTKVDAVAGTAALIPSATTTSVSLMPDVTADGKGTGFWACPSDGTGCQFFPF